MPLLGKWPTNRLSMNSGRSIPQLNGFTVKRKEKNPVLSLCFQRHYSCIKHPVSYCRRQETIMHIIFLHCWQTVEIAAAPFPLESHLPPSVSSSSSTSTDKINAATTAPRLIFLYPALLYFPSSFQGETNVCHFYCLGSQQLLEILVI